MSIELHILAAVQGEGGGGRGGEGILLKPGKTKGCFSVCMSVCLGTRTLRNVDHLVFLEVRFASLWVFFAEDRARQCKQRGKKRSM